MNKNRLKSAALFALLILMPIRLTAQSSQVIQQISQNEYKGELQRDFKTLSLSTILSQGLAKNYDERIRVAQKEIKQLDGESIKDTFWLPNISLEFTTSYQRLGEIKAGTSQANPKSPYGTLALNFGEYTLFNWGKDYLQYKNSLATTERDQEVLEEERRDLRHQIIIKYFNLVTLKKLELSKRNILRQASFIYRFAKERVGLKKISMHDFYAARDSYLSAQADFYDVKRDLNSVMEEISYLISDPVGTHYVLNEEIDYRKLTMPLSEALTLAKKSSKYTKQSSYELANARRSYDLSRKDNLPLPKVTLDLGAYQHSFGSNYHKTQYTNGSTNSLEIVASINAKWDLVGNNGLFNKKTLRTKLLEFDQAQINNARYKHFLESQIRTYYDKIKNSEKLYLIYKVKLENLNKTVDYMIDRYMNGKISYLYYKTYLEELRDTESDFYMTLYNHLKYKVELAEIIGIDDFPGASFSKLAAKVIK